MGEVAAKSVSRGLRGSFSPFEKAFFYRHLEARLRPVVLCPAQFGTAEDYEELKASLRERGAFERTCETPLRASFSPVSRAFRGSEGLEEGLNVF